MRSSPKGALDQEQNKGQRHEKALLEVACFPRVSNLLGCILKVEMMKLYDILQENKVRRYYYGVKRLR